MISLFISAAIVIGSVESRSTIERSTSNVVVSAGAPSFAAFLDAKDSVVGEWKNVSAIYASCPRVHAFTQPIQTNGSRFFRIRLGDNGLVPTPTLIASSSQNSALIQWGFVKPCQRTTSIYRVWRSDDGGDPVWIGTTLPNTAFWIESLPAGFYRYFVQAASGGSDSFLSVGQSVIIPPSTP